jgi:uncharacterized protein YutE (UPF0331/DUF86 family)
MEKRIEEKLAEIERDLSFLMEIIPQEFEEYKSDKKTKAACEHYFERLLENIISICFLLIKEMKIHLPEEEIGAIAILGEEGIIDKELAEKLQNAKRMRNIISHEYGEVDDEIVFNSLKGEIERDINLFIQRIKKRFGDKSTYQKDGKDN